LVQYTRIGLLNEGVVQLMATRAERDSGLLATGEMNAKRFAEHIGVAHGTVKRWLHEGMPASRARDGASHGTWIDPIAAQAWLDERFKGRKTIAFSRRGFIYFIEREDGAIKIGWSSDVMRRVAEIRKVFATSAQLLACYPGDKPDELRLHDTFKASLIGDEWFRPDEDLLAFIDALKERAA
jgi:T5orf172 domain